MYRLGFVNYLIKNVVVAADDVAIAVQMRQVNLAILKLPSLTSLQ